MRMPIDHVRYERLPASSLTEGDVADVDRDRQPSAAARQLVADMACLPACLTPRDNFKIFGDVGLYATLALISIAAGAGASESAATKQIGRTEEESSSRVDHIERTRQKDEPKRPSSKNRRHDALRSELASWPIFYLVV
jgi:hypothetical protein